MKHPIEAVFENGVFRPLKPPDIQDGQQVLLDVEPCSQKPAEDLLALAARVYQGLSENDIDEIESIALDRRHFFNEKHG